MRPTLLNDLFVTTTSENPEHASKLQLLYLRMNQYSESLRVCFWFSFWHAVHLINQSKGVRARQCN